MVWVTRFWLNTQKLPFSFVPFYTGAIPGWRPRVTDIFNLCFLPTPKVSRRLCLKSRGKGCHYWDWLSIPIYGFTLGYSVPHCLWSLEYWLRLLISQDSCEAGSLMRMWGQRGMVHLHTLIIEVHLGSKFAASKCKVIISILRVPGALELFP